MINYISLMNYFDKHVKLKNFINYLNKIITALIFFSYPIFLLLIIYFKREKLLFYILVPMISFAAVSIFRYIYNAPRPYQRFSFTPIGNSMKEGKSFPSRHVFSAFIISFMFFDYNLYLGIIFFVFSALLGILRVLCGVHFIKDILAGALISLLVYIMFVFAI